MSNNRRQSKLSLVALLFLSRLAVCANITTNGSTFDVFDYVNQLIGTDNGGGQAVGVDGFFNCR